jgi:putative peptide zinc metalloprotease protein
MSVLPQLRQELTLTPGVRTSDGAPTWMLHDPAANRFFQLGWPAFELLSRWPLDEPQAILDAVNRETTLDVSADDFSALLLTLRQQNLLVAANSDDTGRLCASAAAGRLSRAMWLLKHYLMIRLPLWRPMAFLRRCAPYVEVAYRSAFWWVIAACAVVGLGMVSRQWDDFTHTFHSYADPSSLLAIGITLAFAKVLHEFGHAFTAYRYGCRVPTMGIAFLVMIPVLYTDTTEAWKVPGRTERLFIGAAGMLTELALAACATLAWSLLPEGPLRAGAFLLATTTWIGTLAINASPFMRFDGYFLLSDWLNMPNLHDRAFAFGVWGMREWLFGFDDPQPEACTPGRRRFLIAFSFMTWLYRLVVFFSIALVVYHAFFKALGVVLFAVELGWFIVRPIVREIAASWRRRDVLRWQPRTIRSATLGTLLLAFLVLPWHAGASAPAVFGPRQAQGLYSPEAGYISDSVIPAQNGSSVRAGAVLAVLISPDLEHKLKQAQAQEKLLGWEVEQQAFDDKLREEGVALRKRWEAARETVSGLTAQLAQLTLRAPFDGIVQSAEEGLSAGTWAPRGERLFDVIGPSGIKGDAFIGESDVGRIMTDQPVRFVTSLPEMGTLQCRVVAVDHVNLTALDERAIASPYGGPVPAQLQPGTQQLLPLQATYRVRLGACAGSTTLARQITGTATIGASRQSFASRGARALLATVSREAGL